MSTMAEMINLRYDVVQELGSGGSGTVFLVEDRLRGRLRCALKALRAAPGPVSAATGRASSEGPEGTPSEAVLREPDPGKREDPFLNEISALLELRHPLLVSLYDFGTISRTDCPSIQGCRYFTMEYVKGTDALRYVRNEPPGPGRARLLELLLAQALSVLSYLHVRGVVHYDIKPQNLLIAGNDGSSPLLKLTDFGFSRKEASRQHPVSGTLEYTAPELLAGECADRRIDLYSLGAAFFQLVEGRCPFEDPEPVNLIKKVLSQDVAFTGSLWQDTPALRRTVAALLERDPAQRPASACEALGLLDTPLPPFPGDDTCRSIFLPFVGRTKEREMIARSIRSLLQGADPSSGPPPGDGAAAPAEEKGFTAFMIYGPEGMGKTRLVEEMVREARIRGFRLFTLEAIAGGVPFQAIASFIRTLKLEIQSLPGMRPQGVTPVVDRIFPEDKPLPEVGDSPQARQAAVEALASFVVDAADRLRMMVVAEDLESIDAASLQVLETVTRDMPPGRALLLMTGTSEKTWPSVSARLSKIPLPELELQDVGALAQAVTGGPAGAEELGKTILRTLGGMPLVVVETLRACKACGSLEEAVGLGVDELLMRRYAALTREKQLLFSFLCCFSYPASKSLLQQILPFQADRFQAAARSLEGEGLIGTAEHGRRLVVRIGRLRNSVYSSLGGGARELHQAIIAVMESSLTTSSLLDIRELGQQCLSAGELRKASGYFERAAREVSGLQARKKAAELFQKAADAARDAGDAAREMALRAAQAGALSLAGLYREAVEVANGLLAHAAPDWPERSDVVRTAGLSLSRLGEFQPARELLQEAARAAAGEGDRASLVQEILTIDINMGRFREAERACREQLALAEKLASEPLRAALLTSLGIATFLQDRFDDAVECFTEALACYERLHDEARVANALINIGNALTARGDTAQGIERWERALEVIAVHGTLSQQAQVQNNMGIAYFNLKEYTRAKERYVQAREIFQRLDSKSGLAYTLTNLGEVELAEGEYQQALESWTGSLELYESMGDARALTETYLHLAQAWLRLGAFDRAGHYLQLAEKGLGEFETFRPLWLFWRAVLHRKNGEFAAAGAALHDARKLYRESGDRENELLCIIQGAECLFHDGQCKPAAEELRSLFEAPDDAMSSLAKAEACYLLGCIEKRGPGTTGERALAHFKKAMEYVAESAVAEISWKVPFALGVELSDRGHQTRAAGYFRQARSILQYFAANISSDGLRKIYMAAEEREAACEEMDQRLAAS